MNQARLGLAELVTNFFTRHLAAELDASPHTIASYRGAVPLPASPLPSPRSK